MDFLSIRIIEQSVIAVAENKRRVCPARQPSPKKSPSFRMPIVASFPLCDTTVSRTFPFCPPSMVERNVLGSDLLSFLAVTTGVVNLPSFPYVQKATSCDQG